MLNMLIILPPSETKATGGTGSPVSMDGLFLSDHSPQMTEVRKRLAHSLITMPEEDALGLLGLRPTQSAELERNAELLTSPTMPAIERYTGVAYDALDVSGARTGAPLSQAARARLAIGSALFGVIGAEDPIPYYRLSAGSKVLVGGAAKPATVRSQWSKILTPALQSWQEQAPDGADGVIDLRSGGYLNLGPLPGALKLRVESEYPDGTRKVVSHFNKHYKGLVARELASNTKDLGAQDLAEGFCELVSSFRTEIVDSENVTLVVPVE